MTNQQFEEQSYIVGGNEWDYVKVRFSHNPDFPMTYDFAYKHHNKGMSHRCLILSALTEFYARNHQAKAYIREHFGNEIKIIHQLHQDKTANGNGQHFNAIGKNGCYHINTTKSCDKIIGISFTQITMFNF